MKGLMFEEEEEDGEEDIVVRSGERRGESGELYILNHCGAVVHIRIKNLGKLGRELLVDALGLARVTGELQLHLTNDHDRVLLPIGSLL